MEHNDQQNPSEPSNPADDVPPPLPQMHHTPGGTYIHPSNTENSLYSAFEFDPFDWSSSFYQPTAGPIPESAASWSPYIPVPTEFGPSPSLYNVTPSADYSIPSVDSGYGSISRMPSTNSTYPEQWRAEYPLYRPDDTSNFVCPFDIYPAALGSTDSGELHAPEPVKNGYISELARLIAASIACYQPTHQVTEEICEALPNLLEECLFGIGGEHPRATLFLLDHRSDITASFKEILLKERHTQGEDSATSNLMNLRERVEKWHSLSELYYGEGNRGMSAYSADLQDGQRKAAGLPEEAFPPVEEYITLIKDTPAFAKLLTDVRCECLLAPATPNTIANIRGAIHGAVAEIKGDEIPLGTVQMQFKVYWSPFDFVQGQYYRGDPETAIHDAITLTGTTSMSQAATCAQYLQQTWPVTGMRILSLVQRLMQTDGPCKTSLHSTVSSQECAWISAYTTSDERIQTRGFKKSRQTRTFDYEETKLLVMEVKGPAACVVEIGEILAWMGSALRSSPYPKRVTYCSPTISYQQTPGTSSKCEVSIRFRVRHAEGQKATSNGQCWHNLFRSPVVVEGYRIPRRHSSEQEGLEIPLKMMAALCQTNRVNPFAGGVFIKGFSTVLVPTMYRDSVVMWHLLFNATDNRISYNDAAPLCAANVSMADLPNARHILGWCSKMKLYAGASDAKYNIKNSNLPGVSADSPLHNMSISMGQIVRGGPPISIGINDIPEHVTRNGYAKRLKWIKKRFILLWDEESQRGWLINGASALLHLVRTSLEKEKDSELSALTLFDSSKIKEKHSYLTESAGWVLSDRYNLQMTVYRDDDEHVLFQHQVTRFYEIMEKMIDYQSGTLNKDPSAGTTRSVLEGWDFDDIASERDPAYPRATILDTFARSWMDLIRSTDAVTLFGRGFGEIIRSADRCPEWSTVPFGRSYIAVCNADLQEIITAKRGNPFSTPVRLTDELIWYIPEGLPCTCECLSGDKNAHSHLAQVLLPSTMSDRLPAKCIVHRNMDNGAFIFGHNTLYPWYWGDFGEPSSQPPTTDSPLKSGASLSYYDSGIGGSSTSSAASDRDTASGLQRSFLIDGSQPSSETINTLVSHSDDTSTAMSSNDYTIGIICALHKELKAVRLLYDTSHRGIMVSRHDQNSYAFGSMCKHNVVATCLPDGEYGTNPAADVASNMKRSFPHLRICLLVGIGGGVPSQNDIRLGDVVVSKRHGANPGVLPYDMTKALDQGVFHINGCLDSSPRWIRSVLSEMQSDPTLGEDPLRNNLQRIQDLDEEYHYPGTVNDKLYVPSYAHPVGETTCSWCSPDGEHPRAARRSPQPVIHYGTIASGNQVIRDPATRDRWGKEHNVLCFEMEAAGIMNILPSLIIRGICDYCDAHKNKLWQKYAAASAAAFAKLLLSRIRPESECSPGPVVEDLQHNEKQSLQVKSYSGEALGKRRRIS